MSNKVTEEDLRDYKKIGTNIEKKKKIKKILFFSLSALTVGIVLGITLGIKKTQNEYHLWKDKNKIYKFSSSETIYDNKYLKYDHDKTHSLTKNDLIKELVYNNNLENNTSLKELNFTNKLNDYSAKIVNVIDNTLLKDTVNFDLILTNKKTNLVEKIIKDVQIKCKKDISNTYSLKDREKEVLNNISKRFKSQLFKFYYEKEETKIEELEKAINEYNSILDENKEINFHRLNDFFRKKFDFDLGKINFLPYAIGKINYDKITKKISFSYRSFILSTQNAKYKKIRFNYFRYIADESKELDKYENTINFVKITNK